MFAIYELNFRKDPYWSAMTTDSDGFSLTSEFYDSKSFLFV